MIKADKYYIENLKNIRDNGCFDENPRPKYKDGTPAYTKFITQVFEEYDISKGEFPITTLRNTAIKTGIKEILAIYQKQQNTRKAFEEFGVFWWESWMNEQGNIGRSYPYNIESHRPNETKKMVVKIKPKLIDEKYGEINDFLINELQTPLYDKVYFDRYVVLRHSTKTDTKNSRFVDIQFLKSGNITTIRKDQVGKTKGFDKYERKTYNIGYIGNYKSNLSKEHINKLMTKWENMFRRCYSAEYEDNYKNIFVHQEWHSFETFLNDVNYIPQFHLALEDDFKDWDLDKDYYGSNCYSKYTCVFLKKQENIIYRKSQIKPIKIVEEGKIYYELTYSALARILNISTSYLRRLIKKGCYKNINFSFIEDDEYIYRYELSRNQVNYLLKNLKEDKYSRRHIISFWNWANIDKKELVECAYETLWSVRKVNDDYYLDMTLISRSNDYITAGAINKIQYVALQMMVAGHLGYKVGKFCHFVQNLHVYDRHMDALNELLDREPLDVQPKLILKENKNFYEYTIDDFEITGIENIKKINSSLELGI